VYDAQSSVFLVLREVPQPTAVQVVEDDDLA
jgi:hypothetical protein